MCGGLKEPPKSATSKSFSPSRSSDNREGGDGRCRFTHRGYNSWRDFLSRNGSSSVSNPSTSSASGAPRSVGTAEQVKCGDVGHELVGIGSPLELVASQIVHGFDHRDTGTDRSKCLPVDDVDHRATTGHTLMLVEAGPEPNWSEPHTWQLLLIELARQAIAVEPRRAKLFERPTSSATLREIGTLGETHTGINQRGVRGGHVGRGRNERQSGLVPILGPAPAAAANDGKLTAKLFRLVQVLRQFPRRHSVAIR